MPGHMQISRPIIEDNSLRNSSFSHMARGPELFLFFISSRRMKKEGNFYQEHTKECDDVPPFIYSLTRGQSTEGKRYEMASAQGHPLLFSSFFSLFD